jgi:hypothetical protein
MTPYERALWIVIGAMVLFMLVVTLWTRWWWFVWL